MDGGPEHRSNFLSVKIAMIALQRYLSFDSLIVARAAPGHLYIQHPPPEKANCVLNLGLNEIGCMRSAVHSNPGFEKHLSNCQRVNDVRNLLKKNSDQNAKLQLGT